MKVAGHFVTGCLPILLAVPMIPAAARAADTAPGAPAPARSATAVPETTARDHWAYRPVSSPPVPAVRGTGFVRMPVDSFIMARLEARGLTLSPPAEPLTLARRIHFDLIELPPTPERVESSVHAWEAAHQAGRNWYSSAGSPSWLGGRSRGSG